MEMSQSKCHLQGEELDFTLWEVLDLDEMTEELTSLDKFHEEVNAPFVLEDIFHVNQERMVYGVQNILLHVDVVHLVVL